MSDAIVIPTGSGDLPARLFLPPTGHGPGLLVLQEIFGVTDYIERRAAQLAELGYVVVVPEIFWRLEHSGPFSGPDALERGVATAEQLDWQQAVLDAAAAVEALRERDDVAGGVGIVGFCFGGGLGYNVAAHLEAEHRRPVDALVSYYGSALPGLVDVMTVDAPSLHHFGLADAYIDNDTVAHIEAAVTRNPDAEFHTYDGADHAFDNDDFPLHHAEASVLAWKRTVEFLGRHLPVA